MVAANTPLWCKFSAMISSSYSHHNIYAKNTLSKFCKRFFFNIKSRFSKQEKIYIITSTLHYLVAEIFHNIVFNPIQFVYVL